MKRFLFVEMVCALILLLAASLASAQVFELDYSVDEQGNGRLANTFGFDQVLTATLQDDPGPGGLASALTYDLLSPPGLVSGDVIVRKSVGGPVDDVIRFNGSNGSLVFYSLASGAADVLADIGFPTAFVANTAELIELQDQITNSTFYTPLAGQPGFIAGAAGPTNYEFVLTAFDLPEPGSIALFAVGLFGVAALCKKRVTVRKQPAPANDFPIYKNSSFNDGFQSAHLAACLAPWRRTYRSQMA